MGYTIILIHVLIAWHGPVILVFDQFLFVYETCRHIPSQQCKIVYDDMVKSSILTVYPGYHRCDKIIIQLGEAQPRLDLI